MPIVTKTIVEGIRQGSNRICVESMGKELFQIYESLEILDNSNHSLTVSIDDGAIKMKDMKFTFIVKKQEAGSDIIVSTNVKNLDTVTC